MTEHLWMIASEVSLWILRSSSEHLYYTASPRNSLFHVQAVELQPSDSVKSYFTGTSQAFSVRTRSSHSKAFIYLKCFEMICEEVNLYWSCNMQTCKFTKETPFTYPPSCTLPSFSKNASRLLLSKRLWKDAIKTSFKKYKQKVVLLVIYLCNYDSSKSTSFMLNVAFYFVLSTFFAR